MYCQLTNSRMFWDSSLARQMQWCKSLICFLCSPLTLFGPCSNIRSVAFRFAGSALDSSWTSSWQSGTLSDCWQSCWSRGSSNINWCQFAPNISPPLCIPCDWNIHVDRCRSSAVKLTEFVSPILALVLQCWTSSLSLFSTELVVEDNIRVVHFISPMHCTLTYPSKKKWSFCVSGTKTLCLVFKAISLT
jgi:hypothetical protein